MSVFVDTSALYALMVRSEEGHAAMAAELDALIASGRTLVSTNYVALEAIALLQRRFGMPAVRDFERNLMPLLRTIWITEPLHRRASARHTASDRRGLSLVDCSSFVVMETEGIREALALDPDFASEGFELRP